MAARKNSAARFLSVMYQADEAKYLRALKLAITSVEAHVDMRDVIAEYVGDHFGYSPKKLDDLCKAMLDMAYRELSIYKTGARR